MVRAHDRRGVHRLHPDETLNSRPVPTGRSVAFATHPESGDLDDGWPAIQAALRSVGLTPEVTFWDDPAVAWEHFDVVVSVYAWGYVTERVAFLSWADRVAAVSHLVNPAPVLRWNSDKIYLADLAGEGIPTVPTVWVAPGAGWDPPGGDYVVKPTVGAGGRGAARYRSLPVQRAARHVDRLHREGQTVMIQPYLSRIDGAGETDLVYIGGHYSHAVTKAALLEADAGETEYLWERQVITPAEPRPDQRELADTVMGTAGRRFGPLGYGRVDLVDGAGGEPVVIELELVEPSLFLTHGPGGAARLADYLRAVSGDAPRPPEPAPH